jgi:hypothetical protein
MRNRQCITASTTRRKRRGGCAENPLWVPASLVNRDAQNDNLTTSTVRRSMHPSYLWTLPICALCLFRRLQHPGNWATRLSRQVAIRTRSQNRQGVHLGRLSIPTGYTYRQVLQSDRFPVSTGGRVDGAGILPERAFLRDVDTGRPSS